MLLVSPLIACASDGLVVRVVSVLAQPAAQYSQIRVKISITNPSAETLHGARNGACMCERYEGGKWIPQILLLSAVFEDITVGPHQTVYEIVPPFRPGFVRENKDPAVVLTYPIRFHVGPFEAVDSHEKPEGFSETLQPKDYLLSVN